MTKYYAIHPSSFKLDGGAMFGIIPKPLWSKKIAGDELNRIKMTMRVLVIETDNKLILIDTGIGDYHPEKFKTQFEVTGGDSPLVAALEDAGRKAQDVTDIIITHLHFDHVGGLGSFEGDKAKLLFENATVHVHRKHYEYSSQPTARDAGSFQSHIFKPWLEMYQDKGQLNLLAQEEGTLLKDQDYELKYLTTKGHTPYEIHPFDKNFFYFGDIIPTSHHVGIPWVMGYDMNPGTTTIEKLQLLEKLHKENITAVFNHDLDSWGASVEKDKKGRFIFDNLKASSKQNFQKLDFTA
jgi:glyoxylase-like metal-dependent hydrolase (beta-lactamase superfamily II)